MRSCERLQDGYTESPSFHRLTKLNTSLLQYSLEHGYNFAPKMNRVANIAERGTRGLEEMRKNNVSFYVGIKTKFASQTKAITTVFHLLDHFTEILDMLVVHIK